jgi:hypothetical protein
MGTPVSSINKTDRHDITDHHKFNWIIVESGIKYYNTHSQPK